MPVGVDEVADRLVGLLADVCDDPLGEGGEASRVHDQDAVVADDRDHVAAGDRAGGLGRDERVDAFTDLDRPIQALGRELGRQRGGAENEHRQQEAEESHGGRLLYQRRELRLRLGVQGRRRAVERGGGRPARSKRRSVGTALTSPNARTSSGVPIAQVSGRSARRRACGPSAPRTRPRAPRPEPVAVALLELAEPAERAPAGRAPGRPELDQDDAAAQVLARERLPVEVGRA